MFETVDIPELAVLSKAHILKAAEAMLMEEHDRHDVYGIRQDRVALATALIDLHREWRLSGGEVLLPTGTGK